MVKLAKYIEDILKEAKPNCLKVDFDIGLDTDMEVNDKSLNRITFEAYING